MEEDHYSSKGNNLTKEKCCEYVVNVVSKLGKSPAFNLSESTIKLKNKQTIQYHLFHSANIVLL